jgi:hypothetical protein
MKPIWEGVMKSCTYNEKKRKESSSSIYVTRNNELEKSEY